MELHFFANNGGEVHIHELVGTDLIHVDSLPQNRCYERVAQYLDECGIHEDEDNPIPENATLEQLLSHFYIEFYTYTENSRVLSIVSTTVDALGIDEVIQSEALGEVKSYMSIRNSS